MSGHAAGGDPAAAAAPPLQSRAGPLRIWPKIGQGLVCAGLLLLGLAVRLYDLTDPPMDFHETRQLGSAIIARGMYYQMAEASDERRDLAMDLWHWAPVYEAPVLERVVALAYLAIGGEHLWMARLISILAWVGGGAAVYALARQLTSPGGGAVALGFYLVSPYAIIASRSFQPDPLMVALIVVSVLGVLRWVRAPTWPNTVLAGALGAAAVFTKAVAVFPVLAALGGAALGMWGVRGTLRRPRLLAVVAIILAPSLLYNLLSITERAEGLFSFWVLSFRDLLREPSFYLRWAQTAKSVVGFSGLVVGMLGVTVARPGRERGALLGLWAGYAAYGLALPYQIMTHDYYHLMLVAIVAVSLAPIGAPILRAVGEQSTAWRALALAVIGVALALPIWDALQSLREQDYRPEAAGWADLGEALPRDGPVIALTHSYGFRLGYYGWLATEQWPYVADQELWQLRDGSTFDFESEFRERTAGMRYFLVTRFDELDRQPELNQRLSEHYPVAAEGDGYRLFDLLPGGSTAE